MKVVRRILVLRIILHYSFPLINKKEQNSYSFTARSVGLYYYERKGEMEFFYV